MKNSSTLLPQQLRTLLFVGCFCVALLAGAQSVAAQATEEIVVEAEEETAIVGLPSDYTIEALGSDSVYGDFVVGPGRFALEIAPGESKTVDMLVTNRLGVPKVFSLTTEDMVGTNSPDEPVALLGEEVGPYSLKDFISVSSRQFTLNHAERVRIPITITIPADAEPGGFYGSILTQIVSDDVEVDANGEAVPGSKIVSRIGTLFFITTPGDIAHESQLVRFSTKFNKQFYTSGPINFEIVTENNGSVHVAPFGELRIFNTVGTEVGAVDLLPWYVLPGSVRTKEVGWNREFLFGRYTAVATINRGYDGVVDEVSYSFWVLPLELLLAVFVGLFIFFLLLRLFFSRFEFRRKD